jgi:hypothetical protein
MYVFPKASPKKKKISNKVTLAKQQLEMEYWVSKALEAGCFSLECNN